MDLVELLGVLLAALTATVAGVWTMLGEKIKGVKDDIDEQKQELSKVRHRLVDLEVTTDRGAAVKLLIEGQQELREQIAVLSRLIESHIAVDKVLGRGKRKTDVDQ